MTLPSPQIQQTILITGGTGSFGSALTARYLADPGGPRVRVYSRSEHNQEAMQVRFPPSPRLSYILADVRDESRLSIAADGVDAIVHAAALKVVPQGERHSEEFVSVNVTGSFSVIRAALVNTVPRCLFVSSDKAVQPVNHYGKSKATAEGMFIEANSLGVSRHCRFAIVRGGNVWGSRGSVTEKWSEAIARNEAIMVNNPDTTRFYMGMDSWLDFCTRALSEMNGGEIFIPKVGAWKLWDLACAYRDMMGAKIDMFGIRGGDKEHESLIAPNEIARTIDIGWAYVIEAPNELRQVWEYAPHVGERVPDGFGYSSDRVERMTPDEFRRIIK